MGGFGILELAVIVAIGTFVLFVFGKIFAQAGGCSWTVTQRHDKACAGLNG